VKQQFVTRDYLANVEAYLNWKEGQPFLVAVAPHLGSGSAAWAVAKRRQKEVANVLCCRKTYCPLALEDWLNAPGNAALKTSRNRKCREKRICARCLPLTPGNKSTAPTPTTSSRSSSSSLPKKRAAPTTSQALAVGEATSAGSPPATKTKVRELKREVRSIAGALTMAGAAKDKLEAGAVEL
jgi:hypothetical protein